MSLCLQAAFGVHPVMSLIKLWKTVFFLSWAWEIGWSLTIWVLVPWVSSPPLTTIRGHWFTTWCLSVTGKETVLVVARLLLLPSGVYTYELHSVANTGKCWVQECAFLVCGGFFCLCCWTAETKLRSVIKCLLCFRADKGKQNTWLISPVSSVAVVKSCTGLTKAV